MSCLRKGAQHDRGVGHGMKKTVGVRVRPALARLVAEQAAALGCTIAEVARRAIIGYAVTRGVVLVHAVGTRASMGRAQASGHAAGRVETRYPAAWDEQLLELLELAPALGTVADVWRAALAEGCEGEP